jgi:hypothetical protein
LILATDFGRDLNHSRPRWSQSAIQLIGVQSTIAWCFTLLITLYLLDWAGARRRI